MYGSYYYIDAVRILFSDDTGTIAKQICLEELRKFCKEANITHTSEAISKYGFKSRLQVTAPNYDALKLLVDKLKDYTNTISYIEIAFDRIVSSTFEAERIADSMVDVTLMRRAKKALIYDVNKQNRDIPMKPGLFSDRTGYWQNDSIKYVIYPRFSKFNGWPCLHVEWRLNKSRNVSKHTGIYNVADLLTFDIKTSFLNLYKRLIYYKGIDYESLGRFVQDMRKKQKNAGVIGKGRFTGGTLAEPELSSIMLMRGNNISCSGELKSYFMKEKKRIKANLKSGRLLTNWEERINRLSNTRLNSFFKPVPKPVSLT